MRSLCHAIEPQGTCHYSDVHKADTRFWTLNLKNVEGSKQNVVRYVKNNLAENSIVVGFCRITSNIWRSFCSFVRSGLTFKRFTWDVLNRWFGFDAFTVTELKMILYIAISLWRTKKVSFLTLAFCFKTNQRKTQHFINFTVMKLS